MSPILFTHIFLLLTRGCPLYIKSVAFNGFSDVYYYCQPFKNWNKETIRNHVCKANHKDLRKVFFSLHSLLLLYKTNMFLVTNSWMMFFFSFFSSIVCGITCRGDHNYWWIQFFLLLFLIDECLWAWYKMMKAVQ